MDDDSPAALRKALKAAVRHIGRLERPKPEPPLRTNEDKADGIIRQIRRLSGTVGMDDPPDLAHLIRIREAVTDGLAVAVHGQRDHHSDEAIGAGLVSRKNPNGITKQAVQKRWPR